MWWIKNAIFYAKIYKNKWRNYVDHIGNRQAFLHLFWLHELCFLFMCAFKFPAWENDLPQDSHLKSLWPLWIVWMCFFKYCVLENDLPQNSHLWSLWASCTMWICVFKCCAWENDLQQDSHFNFFCPWTVLMWNIKWCFLWNDFVKMLETNSFLKTKSF